MKRIYLKLSNHSLNFYLNSLNYKEKIYNSNNILSNKIENLKISKFNNKDYKNDFNLRKHFINYNMSHDYTINNKSLLFEIKIDKNNTLKEYIIGFDNNKNSKYKIENLILLNDEKISEEDLETYFPNIFKEKLKTFMKLINNFNLNNKIKIENEISTPSF